MVVLPLRIVSGPSASLGMTKRGLGLHIGVRGDAWEFGITHGGLGYMLGDRVALGGAGV